MRRGGERERGREGEGEDGEEGGEGEDGCAGAFNIWKYRLFWEDFEAPQPPILGEHILKVPQSWGI